MLKYKQKFMFALLITLLFFTFFVSSAFAWFSGNTPDKKGEFTASSIISYFGGGDGTETEDLEKGTYGPYLIKEPIHLYNLAWLQNRGIFNKKTYFKLAPTNGKVLDMAGFLYGSDEQQRSGAIPPIGTEDNPFIGSFDGNGMVIKNLWISSNPEEWKEQPIDISMVNVGTKIGFFGSIAQEEIGSTIIAGDAQNFVLENLEITTNIDSTQDNNSVVGLIAGFVDANVSNVGIKNGKITIDNVNATSEYSLFGEIGENAIWENGPLGTMGGNLLIDPNLEGNIFTNVLDGNVVSVPDSTEGSAYYSGTLTRSSVSGGVKSYLWYNSVVTLSPNTPSLVTQTASSTNSTSINPVAGSSCPDNFDASMWNRLQNIGQGYYIVPNILNSSSTVVNPDNNSVIPKGCIWFKPAHTGTCTVAGVMTNKGSPLYLSFYTITRNANGQITALNEVLRLVGNGNNKAVFIFNVDIPAGAQNVEYVIGRPTGSSNVAGFFYLILSGVGSSSAGGQAVKIMKVDYVYKINSQGDFVNMLADNYSQTKVSFGIEGNYNGTICFNMTDQPVSDVGIVYCTDASIVFNKLESYNKAVMSQNSPSMFPPRQEVFSG